MTTEAEIQMIDLIKKVIDDGEYEKARDLLYTLNSWRSEEGDES